jgi:hypothetical protein
LIRPARLLLCTLLALALAMPVAAQARSTGQYAARKDVRQFIARMVRKHGFVAAELRALFGRARYQPAIIAAITPPAAPRARSWQAYRALFLTRERIDAGVAFRARNSSAANWSTTCCMRATPASTPSDSRDRTPVPSAFPNSCPEATGAMPWTWTATAGRISPAVMPTPSAASPIF